MGIRRIGKIQMPNSPSPVDTVQRLASEQVTHPKQKYAPPEIVISDANEPHGYESPITIRESALQLVDDVLTEMESAKEDCIWTAIQKVGIDIDKERLIGLIKGDRDSYDRGYQAGLLDGYVTTWKTMLVEKPKHDSEILVACIGEGNQVYLGVWDTFSQVVRVKASNMVIPESDILEWTLVPKRVDLPF